MAADRAVLDRYGSVTLIGAGVIGTSWAALMLAHGLRVTINDPRPDVEPAVRDELDRIAPTLRAIGLDPEFPDDHLRFEADLERAVNGADLVQENGPERIAFKQELWATVSDVVSADALLLSSSSAQPATEQARRLADASRLLVGHPFNPPHLIPLVEVVPGASTSDEAIADAVAFYTAIGKVPRVIHREIPGFVANRLQRALFKECCHLVLEGVVTVDELDDIVTNSIGLRWAVNGPFESFHLGGGPGGLAAFFAQFGGSLDAAWRAETTVSLDEAARQLLIDQAAASFARTPVADAEAARDRRQIAVLQALAAHAVAEPDA
jgi:ketoreductase RED1